MVNRTINDISEKEETFEIAENGDIITLETQNQEGVKRWLVIKEMKLIDYYGKDDEYIRDDEDEDEDTVVEEDEDEDTILVEDENSKKGGKKKYNKSKKSKKGGKKGKSKKLKKTRKSRK